MKELAATELSSKDTSARRMARVAGQIIAMEPGLGSLARLFSKKMYAFVESCHSWDGRVSASQVASHEIQFWENNINQLNGSSIKQTHAVTKIVYSDASDSGYGGYIAQKLGSIVARGNFVPKEAQTSSTVRELLAVKYVLQSLTDHLKHEAVLWHTDNWNVSRILQVGSSKDHIQELALEIFHIRVRNDIKIIPCWVPREENVTADALSKFNDTDDWGIDLETFQYIQQQLGFLDVDRFADNNNAKLRRFNSRFHCPGSEEVNAFTTNWWDDYNWWCPPTFLIADTINHARICHAKGVLLVPEWPSAYFWPIISPDGKHFADFVTRFLVLDPYYCSTCNESIFNGHTTFRTLALQLQF